MHVLLVEDSPNDAELLARALRQRHCEVTVAHDGDDAITLARIHQPELLVSDLRMPGMDGLTLARLVKADPRIKHIPMVAITGGALDEQAAIGAGFVALVSKNLGPAEFAEHILRFAAPEDRAELLYRQRVNDMLTVLTDRVERTERRIGDLEGFVRETYDALRNEWSVKMHELSAKVSELHRANHIQVALIGFVIVLSSITLMAVLAR